MIPQAYLQEWSAKAPWPDLRQRRERPGDEWILNGEKVFIANGSVSME